MVANSGMKHESEIVLKLIRGLVLDFVLDFVTVWQSAFYMQFQHRVQRYTIYHLISTKC